MSEELPRPADESTGNAEVDQVVAAMAELPDLPPDAHVEVFERAHEQLRKVLDGARD